MSTNIGTRLAIATGLPATFNEAGYEALTWNEIGGLISVGVTGNEDDSIPVENVTTGRTIIIKGATTGLRVPVAFRVIAADAGQAAVIAAAATANEFSFRINEPGAASAPDRYFSGPVFNLQRNERSVSSFLGMTFEFADNYGEVSGT